VHGSRSASDVRVAVSLSRGPLRFQLTEHDRLGDWIGEIVVMRLNCRSSRVKSLDRRRAYSDVDNKEEFAN